MFSLKLRRPHPLKTITNYLENMHHIQMEQSQFHLSDLQHKQTERVNTEVKGQKIPKILIHLINFGIVSKVYDNLSPLSL